MAEGGGEATPAALPPAPEPSACAWPVVYIDCSGGACDAYASWPPEEQDNAQAWFEAMAIELLNLWTKGVFGVCEAVVRPCLADCGGGYDPGTTFWGRGPAIDKAFPRGGIRWAPVLINGQWFNVTCGCLGSCTCGLTGPAVLNLPGPVQSVDEVLIDGSVLVPSAYRVANQRQLIRTDGGVWPTCQDVLAPSSEVGTFEVTYQRGVPVPALGQAAAGRLACELALAACDADSCSLPVRLQTVTRQGLSVAVQLNGETFTESTGIWSIDSWVASTHTPKVWGGVRSVDLPSLR